MCRLPVSFAANSFSDVVPELRPFANCTAAAASPGLLALAQYYLHNGLATKTRKTYSAAQRSFVTFCKQHRVEAPLLPAAPDTICLWVSNLSLSLRYTSIKVYLFGLRSLHIDLGLDDPVSEHRQLERVIRGIKREQGEKETKKRLPITTELLDKL